MRPLARIAGLAGVTAALLAGLTASSVAAAGPPVVGHVYVNNNTAGSNTVAAFDRHPNGSLTPTPGSPFYAGGAGTGAVYPSADGLVQTGDGRYLLATDPASNQISVLRVHHDGALALVDVESSYGTSPVSIAEHDGLVYVANGGAGGSNYTGFRLGRGGRLWHIPGSTVALPDEAHPGEVLISPDGTRLVGTRVGPNAGPSYLDAFRIRRDGRLVAAPGSPFAAEGTGPFGSVFSPTRPSQLFVSNAHDGAGNGTVSSFHVGRDGTLTGVSGSPFADGQTAPCWVAITPDGRVLFAINTGSATISAYRVARDGTLTLEGSTPFASPSGLTPFDGAVSADGRYLYVVGAGAAKVSAFRVHGTSLTELAGSPVAIPGGAAPFGMVVD